MNPPLIEIIVHDQGTNDARPVTYRVRPSNLGPVEYGVILAALIRYVASAIAHENPKFDVEIVRAQVIHNTLAALDEEDETQEPLRTMQ